MKALGRTILPYLIAIAVAFAAVGIFIAAMGFDVGRAYQTILLTSFRTPNGFIQTLLKFIPLTLQALAFTVPLTAGKFNIGGEGQMIVGGIAAAAVGITFSDLPPVLLLPMVILAGVLAGAFWGLIPAWLLYRFGLNEILTTVLLNFVSFAVIDLVATGPWRDTTAGHPTTIPIGQGGWLPMLINNPPLHSGIILAVLVAAGIYIYTSRTTGGYELVATGANPRAAEVFGIHVGRMFVFSLVLAGALAGLAGSIEVAGVHRRLIEGMQSNFLVLGLIIGLIARGNNLAVPFVAFFIAVLEVGASAMQRTLMIPVEMVFIVEALVLLFVLLSDVVRRR
ncbi:nucleoside ABC transporter membrane protein [Bellilinea caldifistulae]|jgi:simple sugar transport system permease protein|uniref:Sugar ABC transporter permease n=1 Tax=Bellilinea caldifistulae TaxID=360411 RepID=A0A0P6XI65_9CHLR|nr:ABC transporter permease [Bellilinea caldifistulae]KPL75188.1 sugar ABC transporter permease [Bellilinea caldifistulae]GAP09309.1 nucleoside ABC transporter membrane protein [Bellilinea caldifistulae]